MQTAVVFERFVGWLWRTSWQAAVIAALILLAQLLLRRRLSPAWRHGLWLLLVARLLMPPTPGSGLSVFNLTRWLERQPELATVTAPVVADFAPAPAVNQPPSTDTPGGFGARLPVPMMPATTPLPTPSASRGPGSSALHAALASTRPVDWRAVAAGAWLAGAILLALRFGWLNYRFGQRLADQPPVGDETVRRIFRRCMELLRLRARVAVIETAEVAAPAVYGLWRKRLLLPVGLCGQLSAEELRHVFLHELGHVKRRDPELNWLLAWLQILHWFNPMLWFAFARMRADRELATDDLALAHTQAPDRAAYGETILKVLERLTESRALPGLVGIGESKAELEERMRAIARAGVGRRWGWAAATVALVIAGVGLTNAREGAEARGVDLLERYPTTLTTGDAAPDRARPWEFTPDDIFRLSRFALQVGKALRLETKEADLGIGHCADGAVWAVVIPRRGGTLTSSAARGSEIIADIWLRFHPAELDRIFPPDTVSAPGPASREERMRAIANAKFHSSWHAGDRAMIPAPKDLTVDVDTQGGPRRFFMVDTQAQTAKYVPYFAPMAFRPAAQPAYRPHVDPRRARVLSVAPPDGARNVSPVQKLRIRFDRPMNPYHLKLEWLAGGFQLDGSVQVSADRREFTIPVRLTPGQEQELALNRNPRRETGLAQDRSRDGFLDADLAPANEFRWSFRTKAPLQEPGASRPRLVSVSPPSGATTPVLTRLRLVFDQPMRPPDATFPYLEKSSLMGGPSLVPSFGYDAATRCFTLPALLRADDDTRLILDGFYSANGVPCRPIVLHYQSSAESLDPSYAKQARAAAKDPRLQRLLAAMKAARARLHSGIETVETIGLGLARNTFNSIEAKSATFKWQGADQAYADITGPMSMTKAFILGSDGRNCWLYSEDDQGRKRLDETPEAVTRREILLADPFELANRSVEEALEDRPVALLSDAEMEGHRCRRIEAWDVRQGGFVFAILTQWWIDEKTLLPRQIVQVHPYGCQVVRFDYRDLNQRLPERAFAPPVAPGGDAHPLFFTKAPGPDEMRFLRISDGSNGRMSGRLGWHGPNGTTSSGLN